MAILSGLTSFTAGTKAKASEVNGNFTAVKNFVEALSSGVNIDAGAITNAKLASDVYNFYAPVGGIIQYAGASNPAGGKWLICDGSLLSRSTYASLFTAIGTAYGAGDGSTTFALPNLKGRFPIGLDASKVAVDALGETGGSVSILESNLPAHIHANTASASTSVSVSNAGGHSHSASIANNGTHEHDVNITGPTGSHNHDNQYDYLSAGTNGAPTLGGNATNAIMASGDHGHGITVNAVGDHAHGASATTSVSLTNASAGSGLDYYQPFIVVNYIIRVA